MSHMFTSGLVSLDSEYVGVISKGYAATRALGLTKVSKIPRHLSQPYSSLQIPVKWVSRKVSPNPPANDQEDNCRQREWDDMLPFLLFACREAPCSTTGFSPFELIFGKKVRGSLDVLLQEWMPTAMTTHFAMDWLLQLRQDLEDMRMVATEKQEEIQFTTKHWFDKTSTICNFQIGDKVHFYSRHLQLQKRKIG